MALPIEPDIWESKAIPKPYTSVDLAPDTTDTTEKRDPFRPHSGQPVAQHRGCRDSNHLCIVLNSHMEGQTADTAKLHLLLSVLGGTSIEFE
jgi:hypothetical protein